MFHNRGMPITLRATAAAAVTSVSLFGTATAGFAAVTVPASIQAGDVMVLIEDAAGATQPAEAAPTGFTVIGSHGTFGSTTRRTIASRKISDGTETSLALLPDATGGLRHLYVFRPNIPATVLTPGSIAFPAGTSGNPAAQVVTSSAGTPPLIVFGIYHMNGTGIIDPRTFSTTKDGELEGPSNTWFYTAYKIYDSSPADTSIDMDDEGGSNNIASFYLGIS